MSSIKWKDITRNDAACMMRAPFMFPIWVVWWRRRYGDSWWRCVRAAWGMATAHGTPMGKRDDSMYEDKDGA